MRIEDQGELAVVLLNVEPAQVEHCLDCGAEIIGAHGDCPGVPGGFGA